MIEVRQTKTFRAWFSGLRDMKGRAKIEVRIRRRIGRKSGRREYFDGIGEMPDRLRSRLPPYFVRRGEALILLLCGGDKGSQSRDVRTARDMAKEA